MKRFTNCAFFGVNKVFIWLDVELNLNLLFFYLCDNCICLFSDNEDDEDDPEKKKFRNQLSGDLRLNQPNLIKAGVDANHASLL